MNNSNVINSLIYSYMETAMVVSEEFHNLYDSKSLDEDALYNETDNDTYETLVDIAGKIEDMSQDDENGYTLEDIREKAIPMILEEYGKKDEKEFEVTRHYYKTVKVMAINEDEALIKVRGNYLFDTVNLILGGDEVVEVI